MSENRLNSYHIMWIYVYFDLPVTTKQEAKNANEFRKNLIKDGFIMHQWSVYIRYCNSYEAVDTHIKRVTRMVPPLGKVSITCVTDKQYSDTINIYGAKPKDMEPGAIPFEYF